MAWQIVLSTERANKQNASNKSIWNIVSQRAANLTPEFWNSVSTTIWEVYSSAMQIIFHYYNSEFFPQFS